MKITHDFHLHTHLSLCAPDKTGTIENYIKNAKAQGIKKLGITDHFWGAAPADPEYFAQCKSNATRYYTVQNFEYISQSKNDFHFAEDSGVKLYFGAEAEYDPFRHSVAITHEQAEQMDIVIVPNSHTHMVMPKAFYEPVEKHKEFMFNAFYDILDCEFSRYVTAIAHPFTAIACPYGKIPVFDAITDDEFRFAFDKAANKGIAMEINLAAMTREDDTKTIDYYKPEMRMLRIAKECGCKFTFGSDAHIISEHKNLSAFDEAADALGLCEDDIAEIAR